MPNLVQPVLTPASSSPNKRKLRVLLLEDRPLDAELIVQELCRAGFAPEGHRVETQAGFEAQLSPDLDVILADYRLPQFDGLAALRRLQQLKLDIPFIIISGTIGEELAAQCIKEGVTDYLLKDRLQRLALAVSNAVEDRRRRAEARLIEEQLRQAQKLETIGQLAGGIAHDFNNVLTVINGRAFLLLEDPTLPAHVREALQEIQMAGDRAANITRQLLLMSCKRPIRREQLDLNAVVEDVGKMLTRLIGEHVTFGFLPARDLPGVDADRGMIEQVIINLAVNARDAMPRGGELTITTDAIDLTMAEMRGRPAGRPGSFVCLKVEDTGVGIAAENLPRIFEPFFTTKPMDKGTGLGLATVFKILKQHEGWIEVNSEVGVGTTFDIFLPVTKSTAAMNLFIGEAAPTPPGGHETILLVEDETSVREFAAAVLQPAGYRVLQARSGPEALEVWQQHACSIELLLTDMVMPGDISGRDLAATLLGLKPSLAVLFTSGYAQDTDGKVFEPGRDTAFLHKPYTPRALAAAVRQTLDAARARHHTAAAACGAEASCSL